MADISINPVTRRTQYTGNTGLGPFSFNFNILQNTDIVVYKNSTLLTLTTDYTVTINANGTGSVTLTGSGNGTALVLADLLTIVGGRELSRTTDFVTAGDLLASSLNEQLDSNVIMVQQLDERFDRAMKLNIADEDGDLTLPLKSSRAGKTLAFDSSGNPVVGEDIGNWRGDWVSGTTYTVRDLVKDGSNENVYRVNTAHTSSGSTPLSSNTNSSYYDLVVDAESAATSASNAASSASAAASSASAASTSASNAATSATNASNSASAASTSASNAATSETNASNSATSASTSASNASTSATNAATSASNASTSETNAASSASSASTSATSAATSASSAATSATNAGTSAGNASTSETNAANSASAAATSASNASTSESNAAASAASAAASFDAFDDIYLGAKASDPTVDNDGDALTAGDQYFNTTTNVLKVYNGSAWQNTEYSDLSLLDDVNITTPANGSLLFYDSGTSKWIDNPTTNITSVGTLTGFTSTGIDDNATSTAITIDSSQNVGIGTASPSGKLDVELGATGTIAEFRGADVDILQINSESDLIALDIRNTTNGLDFQMQSTSKMRLTTAGNLGVGTTSPVSELHIASTSPILTLQDTNSTEPLSTYIDFLDSAGNEHGWIGYGSGSLDTMQIANGYDDIIFFTGTDGTTSERMRIDSSGNVGIGTSSPNTLLTMQDDSTVDGSLLTFKNQYRVSTTTADTMGGIAFSAWRDVSSSASYCAAIYGKNTGYPGSSGNLVFATRTNGSTDPYDVTERMIIDSPGNVGIGTTSPQAILHVSGVAPTYTNGSTVFYGGTTNNGVMNGVSLWSSGNALNGGISSNLLFDNGTVSQTNTARSSGNIYFNNITTASKTSEMIFGGYFLGTTSFVERMRIDSSGNLLVGKTSADDTTAGVRVNGPFGFISAVRDGNLPLLLNRLTSDGTIADFRKDGTSVGSIFSHSSGNMGIGNGDTGVLFAASSNSFQPWNTSTNAVRDNAISMGISGGRWSVIYAGTGTINTSDEREKQDIEKLSQAEQNVAVTAKTLLRKYRWKDAVADKGDDARIHFGIIAQDLKAAFEAEGLEAGKYGMFCYDEWWEDSEGNTVSEGDEGAVKKDRMGIRYSELLAFIIAGI